MRTTKPARLLYPPVLSCNQILIMLLHFKGAAVFLCEKYREIFLQAECDIKMKTILKVNRKCLRIYYKNGEKLSYRQNI